MEYGIKPPRGAVKLIDARNTTGGWQVHCTNCGQQGALHRRRWVMGLEFGRAW